MRSVLVSRSIASLLGLGIILGACSQAAVEESAPGQVLAYSDESIGTLGCESIVALLLSDSEVLNSDSAKEPLLSAISDISVDAAANIDKWTDLKASATNSERAELESILVSMEALEIELDDLTSQECAVPVWTAAYALWGAEILPTYLPCFVYRPDEAEETQYVAIDCNSGQDLYLHSDGAWQTEPEPAMAPTTTAVPRTTIEKVTRPEPSIPASTVPPTTEAQASTTFDETGTDSTPTSETTPTTPPEI